MMRIFSGTIRAQQLPASIIAAALSLLLVTSRCDAGLVTSFDDGGHWVAAGEYSGPDHAGGSQGKSWSPALDGSTNGERAEFGAHYSDATTTYNLNAGPAVLKSNWTFERAGGAPYGTNAWWHTRFNFQVTEQVQYAITGFANNSAGRLEFLVRLEEHGVGWRFYSSHEDNVTGTHVVGGAPTPVYLGGTPEGLLTPGATYNFWIRAVSHGVDAAEGDGEVTLTLSSVNAVPEPTSLALLGISACITAVGTTRRRRRESASGI